MPGMARNNLQERRTQRRLKQRDVAEATGVQQPVLSQWEGGRIPIAVRHAMRLAQFFNTTVEELFARELLDADDEDDVGPGVMDSGRHPAARVPAPRTGTGG